MKSKIKVYLSAAWLVLTFSMVSWWFLYALRIDDSQTSEAVQKHHRMIKWEGGSLLFIILIGGMFLIMYVYRDTERHERLKLFFSNFSHDIKTSIARIRLQADVLAEELNDLSVDQRSMSRLLADLNRLDLQLENSLLLTHVDESTLLFEDIDLRQLIAAISHDFDRLNIIIEQNVFVRADQRSFKSILRNIIQNSVIHGKASEIKIKVENIDSNTLKLIILDNGHGSDVDLSSIGRSILPVKQNQSNGIGLYLASRLIKKMSGQIQFNQVKGQGFTVEMILQGRIVS